MQKPNVMWYAVGRTVNSGNFESIRVDFGESIEVLEDEDREEAIENLKDRVDNRLNKVVSEILKQLKGKK